MALTPDGRQNPIYAVWGILQVKPSLLSHTAPEPASHVLCEIPQHAFKVVAGTTQVLGNMCNNHPLTLVVSPAFCIDRQRPWCALAAIPCVRDGSALSAKACVKAILATLPLPVPSLHAPAEASAIRCLLCTAQLLCVLIAAVVLKQVYFCYRNANALQVIADTRSPWQQVREYRPVEEQSVPSS